MKDQGNSHCPEVFVERGCDARCIDRCIGTHIYRLHGGAATSSNIQERRGPSVNIQDTYVPYIYTQQRRKKKYPKRKKVWQRRKKK
jgi:hypothetical protein